MGREALVYAEVDGQAGEVKALLESSEVILRGEIRRRYPKPELENVRVVGEALRFRCLGEQVRLDLGSRTAEAWRQAVATPPPSLRSKLGLGEGKRALLVGASSDVELCGALDGATADDVGNAEMIVACVEELSDLEDALTTHALKPSLHLWIVYRKGRGVTVGDSVIRARLRSAGFRDTKCCAVSDVYTAARYSRS